MTDRHKEIDFIRALLRELSTLALATTDELGGPWVTPLFYLVDDDLTLFWLSSKTSLHSVNIKRLPKAAISVYRQAESWKDIQGVQMRGSITIVADKRRRSHLIKTYCRRFQLGAVFNLVISRCDLFAFRPEFARYIDNSRMFGTRTEFERGVLEKWTVVIP